MSAEPVEDRAALLAVAGTEKMHRHAARRQVRHRLGQHHDVLAAIDAAGEEHDDAIRRNAEALGEPGAVALVGVKEAAIDAAAQQGRVTLRQRRGRSELIGPRHQHAGAGALMRRKLPQQAPLGIARQAQSIEHQARGGTVAEQALHHLRRKDPRILRRIGMDRIDQRNAASSGDALRRPRIGEIGVGGMDQIVIHKAPGEARMERREIGMVGNMRQEWDVRGAEDRRVANIAHVGAERLALARGAHEI